MTSERWVAKSLGRGRGGTGLRAPVRHLALHADLRGHGYAGAVTVVAESIHVRAGDQVLLDPTSFVAAPGEVVAVRGPNGSGKTTLLRVIAGLLRPTSGRAIVANAEVDELDPAFRGRVASLIGLPPLARNLTLAEHLRLVAMSWGADPMLAEAVLGFLGLEAFGSRFPHELSSGQTQLFALALTFARPSEVLVLDEPEQRLDQEKLALVAGRLAAFAAQGGTVVMATHSRWLVEHTSGRTIHLAGAPDVR